jgi:hypothetical protein
MHGFGRARHRLGLPVPGGQHLSPGLVDPHDDSRDRFVHRADDGEQIGQPRPVGARPERRCGSQRVEEHAVDIGNQHTPSGAVGWVGIGERGIDDLDHRVRRALPGQLVADAAPA